MAERDHPECWHTEDANDTLSKTGTGMHSAVAGSDRVPIPSRLTFSIGMMAFSGEEGSQALNQKGESATTEGETRWRWDWEFVIGAKRLSRRYCTLNTVLAPNIRVRN